jgi:hypothetical protein
VELVTQQRIKFLLGLDGKRGQDQADAAWSAAVDSWIPAWKRFQEQEAERINAKQGKRGRKRKSMVQAEASRGYHVLQLPSGFDTMFASQSKPDVAGTRSGGGAGGGGGATKGTTVATVPSASTTAEPNVSAAILETLSKLNKNLEAVSSRTQQQQQQQSSSTAAPPPPQHPHHNTTTSSSRRNSADKPHPSSSATTIGPHHISSSILEQIKGELRADFRREMEKDRAELEEKLEAVQRTQEMILELLRQEPQ